MGDIIVSISDPRNRPDGSSAANGATGIVQKIVMVATLAMAVSGVAISAVAYTKAGKCLSKTIIQGSWTTFIP